MSTKGRKGRITKRISVYSNDPETPRYELTLTGEITTDVNITPSSLSFGEMLMGETGTKSFEIEIVEPEKVKLTSVTAKDERFTAKKLESGESGHSKWEVTFTGSNEKERISTVLSIGITGSEVDHIDMPVRANIVGNLRYPSHVYLLKRDGEYQTRTFKISSRVEGSKFKITDVKDPDDNLALKIVKQSGTETEIEVNLKDPKRTLEQSLKGTMTLNSSDKREPTLEIRYTATSRNNARNRRRALENRRKGLKRKDLETPAVERLKAKNIEGAKAKEQ